MRSNSRDTLLLALMMTIHSQRFLTFASPKKKKIFVKNKNKIHIRPPVFWGSAGARCPDALRSPLYFFSFSFFPDFFLLPPEDPLALLLPAALVRVAVLPGM